MNRIKTQFGATRSHHLVDVENLCGEPLVTAESVARLRRQYFSTVRVGPLDQFTIASCHANVMATSAGWPRARYLVRSGKDGADICLAKVVVEEHLEDRFESVYFGSGDGGLAPFAAHLGQAGVRVTAVSRIRSISPHMKLAAAGIIYLDRPGIVALRAA